eukprot:m.10318 g.10318  ORF g.10318 m.10318 type:complete len:814 (-) comp3651_c0_seq2:140-2581(-)
MMKKATVGLLVGIVAIIAVMVALCNAHEAPASWLQLMISENGYGEDVVVMENGFVRMEVNTDAFAMILKADFLGHANYSVVSSASSPSQSAFTFTRYDTSGSTSCVGTPVSFQVMANTTKEVSVKFTITDSKPVTASQTLIISLIPGSRAFTISTTGSITNSSASTMAYVNEWMFRPISIYGFFDEGSVQMRSLQNGHFSASHKALRIYGLGTDVNTPSSFDMSFQSLQSSIVMTTKTATASSSVQIVVAGAYPGEDDVWDEKGWYSLASHKNTYNFTSTQPRSDQARTINRGVSTWHNTYELFLNDRNFPTSTIPTTSNIPTYDLEAFLTGVYGSSPGCLCTYPNEVKKGEHVYQIATTINRPGYGYGGTYNYFDPDNFISLSSILYSGDAYLQEQARQVIERSGAFLKPNGQLPHHFNVDVPVYLALSGATQTGPNAFWTLTGLQYAKVTGNTTWLQEYMPTLRLAANFCFNLIDMENYLLDAPGSLMIDVFIRSNFTSDSNAMIVGLLREFAEAEELVGNYTGATLLRSLAVNVTNAVNERLWASNGVGRGGNDHYITQLNPDNTTRDFVDYDSNFIAIAYGIPSDLRSESIINRIDKGHCAAAGGGGPEWVSEVYYGPKDTVNGNIGDSATAMGRIAWFESHARKRIGDRNTFDEHIMSPLERDLIANTWLHERYECSGDQMTNRTDAYFEYPATVAMLLREIRYGVNLGLRNVTINPFGPTSFVYSIGNIFVQYTNSSVTVGVPGKVKRTYVVEGLIPNATFSISADQPCSAQQSTATSNEEGTLTFVFQPQQSNCAIHAAINQSSIN